MWFSHKQANNSVAEPYSQFTGVIHCSPNISSLGCGLPRDVVDALFLETFKARLDQAMDNLI